MAIREHSIFDCILSNSQNIGGETALVSGELRLTFAELPLHVNCLARGLSKPAININNPPTDSLQPKGSLAKKAEIGRAHV